MYMAEIIGECPRQNELLQVASIGKWASDRFSEFSSRPSVEQDVLTFALCNGGYLSTSNVGLPHIDLNFSNGEYCWSFPQRVVPPGIDSRRFERLLASSSQGVEQACNTLVEGLGIRVEMLRKSDFMLLARTLANLGKDSMKCCYMGLQNDPFSLEVSRVMHGISVGTDLSAGALAESVIQDRLSHLSVMKQWWIRLVNQVYHEKYDDVVGLDGRSTAWFLRTAGCFRYSHGGEIVTTEDVFIKDGSMPRRDLAKCFACGVFGRGCTPAIESYRTQFEQKLEAEDAKWFSQLGANLEKQVKYPAYRQSRLRRIAGEE